jgi:hypothetical protein
MVSLSSDKLNDSTFIKSAGPCPFSPNDFMGTPFRVNRWKKLLLTLSNTSSIESIHSICKGYENKNVSFKTTSSRDMLSLQITLFENSIFSFVE